VFRFPAPPLTDLDRERQLLVGNQTSGGCRAELLDRVERIGGDLAESDGVLEHRPHERDFLVALGCARAQRAVLIRLGLFDTRPDETRRRALLGRRVGVEQASREETAAHAAVGAGGYGD
jgi:hypothetical protein